MRKVRKSQSTLEYVIVFTAIVSCIAWAADAVIRVSVEQGLDDVTTAVDNVATQIGK